MPPKRNVLKLTQLKPHKPQEMKEKEDQYEADLRQLQQWRETNRRLQFLQAIVQNGIYTGEFIAQMLITQQNYTVGMRGMNMIMHVADQFSRRQQGIGPRSNQAQSLNDSRIRNSSNPILIRDNLFDQLMREQEYRQGENINSANQMLVRSIRDQLQLLLLAAEMSERRRRLMESNPDLFFQTIKQFNQMHDQTYVDMFLTENYDAYHDNFITQFNQSGRQFHVEIGQNGVQVYMTGDLYPFQQISSSSEQLDSDDSSQSQAQNISSSFNEDKDTQYQYEQEKSSQSFQKKENIDNQNKIELSKEQKNKKP